MAYKSHRAEPTVPLKKEVYEVPGPGAYATSQMQLVKPVGGVKFGKAQREAISQEPLPGPGEYTPLVSSLYKPSHNVRL